MISFYHLSLFVDNLQLWIELLRLYSYAFDLFWNIRSLYLVSAFWLFRDASVCVLYVLLKWLISFGLRLLDSGGEKSKIWYVSHDSVVSCFLFMLLLMLNSWSSFFMSNSWCLYGAGVEMDYIVLRSSRLTLDFKSNYWDKKLYFGLEVK